MLEALILPLVCTSAFEWEDNTSATVENVTAAVMGH